MSSQQPQLLTNYAAFQDPVTGSARIGHLLDGEQIQPLVFLSGTPVRSLYEVIEAGSSQIRASPSQPLPLSSVKLLPPISGRDVLAVGKNYMEHAKEFNSSGYDSSDKVDRPSHPVIFTKRATSIIAHGEEIYLHPEFSQTVDYEGEIGVIIGKPGFRIREEDAWDFVWGFTIINDVTARERQRDHKQFYIGKSADTFCPMGPIAVPKERLPKTLRVQTSVNGELRQNATTEDLIFSIPTLVRTLSEGQTLQPGDVLATGTPAGVGLGLQPPIFLQSGDEVAITIDGIGTLRNRIASRESANPTVARVKAASHFSLSNGEKSEQGKIGLTTINSKPLYYKKLGAGSDNNIVFIHGLGGTNEYWTPLISLLSLEKRATLHLFDLEGHGLSPTHPLHEVTISSLAADVGGVFETGGINSGKRATIIAHSMGCLVASHFALRNPDRVQKLILLGPPPSPGGEIAGNGLRALGEAARKDGMQAVVDAVVASTLPVQDKVANPLALAAARLSLLGQDPEGYAKACYAIAGQTEALDLEALQAPTLIVTGENDTISSLQHCEELAKKIPGAKVATLSGVGHWHVYEDPRQVAEAVEPFL